MLKWDGEAVQGIRVDWVADVFPIVLREFSRPALKNPILYLLQYFSTSATLGGLDLKLLELTGTWLWNSGSLRSLDL